MKRIFAAASGAALMMAVAAPAVAQVVNGGFEAAGASAGTTITGAGAFAVGVANGWNMYSNSNASTTAGEVSPSSDPFAPGGGAHMFRVTSDGDNDGLYQLTGGFGFLSADFYVLSGAAQLLSAKVSGATYGTVVTDQTRVWQHLTLNSNGPTVEIALYTAGAGDFYVDNVITGEYQPGALASSITTFAGSPTPEPATWAMMLVGFGGLGAKLRRRRATVFAA